MSRSEIALGHASLFLRGLELPARLGVYPRERRIEQRIRLDLELGPLAIFKAAEADRLPETVDYDAVAATAREVVGRGHFSLVESLAAEIAESVLRQHPAHWVRLRLEKLGCQEDGAAAGVELTVHRDRAPQPLSPAEVVGLEPVVIVGGGVAGISAALWVHRLGHRALLIDDAEQLGGQLRLVHRPMPDIPGFDALDGAELSRRLLRQFVAMSGRWLQCRLEAASASPGRVRVRVGGPASAVELRAAALILCTGIRRRRLEVDGERQLQGRGLLKTAARHGGALAGRRVVVVGGGDAACENARLLAEEGARVTVVHRRERPTAREQYRRALEHESIQVVAHADVVAFEGEDRLRRVVIAGPEGRVPLKADAALIRVGWRPNIEALPEAWIDPRGFVAIDSEGRVRGERRVFAAGDVVGPLCPSVAVSMGTGATAARAACNVLERRPV